MLLDINFFFDHILIVLLLTAIVILIKVLISGIAAFVLGYPARTAIIAALLIFQVGNLPLYFLLPAWKTILFRRIYINTF